MSKAKANINKITCRIECRTSRGVSVGTGFWFMFSNRQDPSDIVPLLITNKHVVKDAIKADVIINVINSDTKAISSRLVTIDLKGMVFDHPNKDVDLCCIPVAELMARLERENLLIDNFSFTQTNIINSTDKFSIIEEVYMTGYPDGVWDSVNNRPITRKGITASSIHDQWMGKNEFMIDIACYPGSSGSPVYILENPEEDDCGVIKSKYRFLLVGILYGGPAIEISGNVKLLNLPDENIGIFTSNLPMNLGCVINAKEVFAFISALGLEEHYR